MMADAQNGFLLEQPPLEMAGWRRVLIILGACLIVASFALPMFPQRIVSATTVFSGGTVTTSYYDVLVRELGYTIGAHPLKEEFVAITAQVAPVNHWSSGLGWMAAILSRSSLLVKHISLVICLAMPLLAMACALTLVLRSRTAPDGLAKGMVPATINLSWMALMALFFAWCHQFDFSFLIQGQYATALKPGIGWWGSLLGAVLIFVGAWSLRHSLNTGVLNWWALVGAVALAIWLLTRFRPYPYLEIWRFVQDGILVTLRIVVTSFGFILLVSLIGGLGRISRSPIIYGIASLYVELIRGIPLLVQLLFIWYALPQVFDMLGNLLLAISPSFSKAAQHMIDLRLSPFTAAVVGLTFCYGAYGSEIFRAGISSIHSGQMEAARSLGMSYFQAMRHVVLPQAVRVILPPIGNEFVALLKDSSLVSVLAVSDLTRRGREYMARTFLSFDTWIMVALCYLVLTLFSSRAVEFIESKTRFER